MSILNGYKKVKDRILTDSGYKLLSRWTSSNTVECNDGKTIEAKIGDINGIVTTLNELNTTTDNSFVPSATAVKAGLDAANSKLHEHNNKSILDAMTQTLVDHWNAAWGHVTDAAGHITSIERTNWDDANSKKHTHNNKTVLDTITQTLIDTWNKVTDKVDKVDGKGLSTNDYTTTEKAKLAGIASEAEKNIILGIQKNGSDLTVDSNRKINITVPTKVSELTNDSGFKTSDTTYGVASTSVNGLMSSMDKLKLDGITSGANSYTHPDSGVTAGTYRSVTVNTQGHVTVGANPTTLVGYGITDALKNDAVIDGGTF